MGHLILFLGIAPLLFVAIFAAINLLCEGIAISLLYVEQIIRQKIFNIE